MVISLLLSISISIAKTIKVSYTCCQAVTFFGQTVKISTAYLCHQKCHAVISLHSKLRKRPLSTTKMALFYCQNCRSYTSAFKTNHHWSKTATYLQLNQSRCPISNAKTVLSLLSNSHFCFQNITYLTSKQCHIFGHLTFLYQTVASLLSIRHNSVVITVRISYNCCQNWSTLLKLSWLYYQIFLFLLPNFVSSIPTVSLLLSTAKMVELSILYCQSGQYVICQVSKRCIFNQGCQIIISLLTKLWKSRLSTVTTVKIATFLLSKCPNSLLHVTMLCFNRLLWRVPNIF